ncbi:MAG: hybrid sensor histidine kinase/response regulator [Ignavibacteriaceae bacterium]|jgi:signal transduction histidine kinase
MTEQQNIKHALAEILLVDDTPANLQLLSGMLKEQGYKVRPVPSGKLALQVANIEPPDLILLDILMPEMNGYEVCEKLKADDKLKEIPVIFISALSETIDKVKGFLAGGVDYITKPFQFEEVHARVRTHLELRRQKQELKKSYEQLKELGSLRDGMTHMIAHDMRSPLSLMATIFQTLEKSETKHTSDKNRQMVHNGALSTAGLLQMVDSLLDINKLEAGHEELKLINCDLVEISKVILREYEYLRESRRFIFDMKTFPVRVICDYNLISRVIRNLFMNALKFTPKDGAISITVESLEEDGSQSDDSPGKKESARVTIQDTGQGIPAHYLGKVFNKFVQVESREFSTGLGLTFCKLAVEAHGGHISVESEEGKGSTFWFTLPN